MRTAAFVISMMLASALTSTTSTIVHETMSGVTRLHAALLIPEGDGKFSAMSQDAEAAIQIGANGGLADKNCKSAKFCSKKEKICSNACEAKNGRKLKLHLPVQKCFYKCKKCIPNC